MHGNFVRSVGLNDTAQRVQKAEPDDTGLVRSKWWGKIWSAKPLVAWKAYFRSLAISADIVEAISSRDDVWEILAPLLDKDFVLTRPDILGGIGA
eukprot:3982156-Karenia_brevis.AAC.1